MSSVTKYNLTGYEEFRSTISIYANNKEGKQVNVFFVGNRGDKDLSWCPDCNEADANVHKAVQLYAPTTSVFIEVQVGTAEEYKNLQNKFRIDPLVHLIEIPTLLRWKTPIRLEGKKYCSNLEFLQMFFEDEID